MSDIFISYSRVDYAKAEQLADVLKADWSVWWDPKILPGESFDDVIREELEKAKAVVVLWSSSSVKSAWVKDEADYALKKGILVPALVEAVEIPFGFRRIEAANLIDWHGDGSNLEYKNLKSAITKKLRSASPKNSLPVGNLNGHQRFFRDCQALKKYQRALRKNR
jgi:TIR domain